MTEKEWIESQREMLNALVESAIVAGIVSQAYLNDPACFLQIGAAVCLDKPIALVVVDDCELPKKLRGVADRVIRVKRHEMYRAASELAQFAQNLKGGTI